MIGTIRDIGIVICISFLQRLQFRIRCLQRRSMKKKKVGAELAEVIELLQAINKNRPMSELHPRFQIFQEALNELVSRGEINTSEVAYFAFCYAEQQGK